MFHFINKFKQQLSLVTTTTSIEMNDLENDNRWKTKEERSECSKAILKQLTDLGLTIQYPAVASLMRQIRDYINEGKRIKVSIPFPEVNRRIYGVLAIGKREETSIILKHEKF